MQRRLIHAVQRVLLAVSFRIHRRRRPARRISWVVGPTETASMVASIAAAVTDSYSVCLERSRFSDADYDFSIRAGRFEWLRRVVLAPIALGRLAAAATGIIYVGPAGFLFEDVDDREAEFRFLRRHGVRIVCCFVGSDIRSPKLLRRFEEETGLETIATYLAQVHPAFATDAYDDQRRRVARVAESYADEIFTAAVDQMGYFERPTRPFLYFVPDELVLEDDAKHRAPGRRIVVHAPTSPIIKGTQVVRAAVARLRSEGYDFEYRELQGVSHTAVLAHLREAHIVLNEFYAFVPGVFGVEAMASGCALLTRADERIETDLPAGSNEAWAVTTAADIAANLRALLDDPADIERLAGRGRAWMLEHASASASRRALGLVLDALASDGSAPTAHGIPANDRPSG